MSKLSAMTGAAGAGRRLAVRLRRLPRTLYEDLWASPVDPLPAPGRPGSPVWRPVFAMLLVLAAATVTLFHVYDLIPPGAGVPASVVLFAVLQSATLIAGLSRPLYAWWVSLVLMVVSVRLSEPVLPPTDAFPAVPDIALQSGALFLLALRVPRAGRPPRSWSAWSPGRSRPRTTPSATTTRWTGRSSSSSPPW